MHDVKTVHHKVIERFSTNFICRLNYYYRVEKESGILKKIVSGIMQILLLTSMLTLVFNIQPTNASETIYIKADGSVDSQRHA